MPHTADRRARLSIDVSTTTRRRVRLDKKGVKQRPGLLVSSARYHRGRREAILAAITSQVGRSRVGDHRLTQWKEAGLPLPSTVTGIIRTIKQDMIIRKIGALPPEELATVEAALRVSLALVEAN